MRWLKLCPDILSTAKRDWANFFRAHLQVFPVEVWSGKDSSAFDDQSRGCLRLCRFRNLMVKTNQAPDGFHGRFLTDSAICGHALEAGLDWHRGSGEDNFPILNEEWRIMGESDQYARDFLEVSDSTFSVDAVKAVVEAGNKIAGNYADIRLAARQVQEIHIGSIAKLAQNSRELLSGDPVFGEEIARLRELGALPHYGHPLVRHVLQVCRAISPKPHSWRARYARA